VKETSLAADEALALLRENLSRLGTLSNGLAPGRLHTPPGPGTWSANDVLAHLRACADVWGGNIAKILAEEHPAFAGTNPRTWMKKTDYPEWAFEDAFRAFAAQRASLLHTLEALAPGDWERPATVRAYGQANERTLRSYASQLALHERKHVRQIEQALGA